MAGLVAVLALTVLSQAPAAQSVALKLATLLPDGSIWDQNLKQMAAEWKQATGDRVEVTVFAAARRATNRRCCARCGWTRCRRRRSPSSASAASIRRSTCSTCPFFFESYDELNAVVEKLAPTMKQRAGAKGFVLLNWGHGGWLQVFSKRPVQTLADLQAAQAVHLGRRRSDDAVVQGHGFQPRAMAMTDILTGLTTGMLDALPTPPLAAMAFQWNRQDALHARHRTGARRGRHRDQQARPGTRIPAADRAEDAAGCAGRREAACRARCPSRTRSPSR